MTKTGHFADAEVELVGYDNFAAFFAFLSRGLLRHRHGAIDSSQPLIARPAAGYNPEIGQTVLFALSCWMRNGRTEKPPQRCFSVEAANF